MIYINRKPPIVTRDGIVARRCSAGRRAVLRRAAARRRSHLSRRQARDDREAPGSRSEEGDARRRRRSALELSRTFSTAQGVDSSKARRGLGDSRRQAPPGRSSRGAARDDDVHRELAGQGRHLLDVGDRVRRTRIALHSAPSRQGSGDCPSRHAGRRGASNALSRSGRPERSDASRRGLALSARGPAGAVWTDPPARVGVLPCYHARFWPARYRPSAPITRL